MPNPAKIPARVESVITHGDGVYSVTFTAAQRFPRFRPGQFLHLTAEPFDPASGFWPESRVFSIASRSGRNAIGIVYAVKGGYTRKLEAHLRPGSEVWLKLPYGDFVIDSAIGTNQDVVMIAGGTGIAPYIPHLEELVESASPSHRVFLAYGIRRTELLLFEDLLCRCSQVLKGFRWELFVEQPQPSVSERVAQCARLSHGVLSIDKIFDSSRELRNPVYFLSGPAGMVKSFKQKLLDLGVQDERVQIDEWD